jgi:hypothetical protein
VRRKFLATGGSEAVLADLERIDLLGPAAVAEVLAAAVTVQDPV